MHLVRSLIAIFQMIQQKFVYGAVRSEFISLPNRGKTMAFYDDNQ